MNRRGVVLIIMALVLMLMSVMVMGLFDVGRISTWKLEAQRAADSASLAGVSGFADGDADTIRIRVQQYASKNTIGGVPAEVDSLVIDTLGRVRVVVGHNTGPLMLLPHGGRIQAGATARIALSSEGRIKVPKGNAWGWYKNEKKNDPAAKDSANIALVE